MFIRKLNVDVLKPASYNPRVTLKPGDKEYEKLKKSISEYGYVEPIIYNKRTNVVIGGHQRLNVLIDLGYKEVEVVEVDLDPIKEKSLNVALNKISGHWDDDKLEALLRELDDSDIDMELTGFDASELDEILNCIDKDIEDEAECEYDEIDKMCEEVNDIVNNIRNIKLGDMYKLGNHVLLCGDSFNKNTLESLLDGKSCGMVFTDPPYEYDSFNYNDADKAGKDTDVNFNNLKTAINKGFCRFEIKYIEYILTKGIPSLYFCCNRHDLYKYLQLGYKYNYKCDIHFMYKQNSRPLHTTSYINDVEYVVYMRLPGAVFNGKLPSKYYKHMQKEPTDEEIVEKKFYSHVYFTYSCEGKKESTIDLKHPTIKPLRLIIPKIAVSSNEGDIIVDLFCGSGSTLIACEKLNRICYTIEYDPEYCNETIDRWEAYTGRVAEYIGNIGEV